MRTMSPVIPLAIAIGMCIADPSWRVLAQRDSPDSYDPSDSYDSSPGAVVCQSTSDRWLLGGDKVIDAPFSAEVITAWRPPDGRPEMRAAARYYRNSAGQVRVEQLFVGHDSGPQRIILKPDPGGKWTYALDPVALTSTRVGRNIAEMLAGAGGCNSFVLPVSMNRLITFYIEGPQTLYPTLGDDESLAPRTVAGIHAVGTRFTMLLPGNVWMGRGERWVSPELKLVVASHGEDPKIGSIDYAMTTISRAEPPAELFEVPAEYASAPQIGKCFANPYNVPLSWCKGVPDR